MTKPAVAISRTQVSPWWRQIALLLSASLFVALCARFTMPLPFTPVPLTVQNFAVLLVGLVLGSRLGFAALLLYLAEGAVGLPVFNPTGPGGIAQILGPTGGYLLAYPFVAALVGLVGERGAKTFRRAALAATLGEVLLFAAGTTWLLLFTRDWSRAVNFGLYPFLPAELVKVMAAAAIALRLPRIKSAQP